MLSDPRRNLPVSAMNDHRRICAAEDNIACIVSEMHSMRTRLHILEMTQNDHGDVISSFKGAEKNINVEKYDISPPSRYALEQGGNKRRRKGGVDLSTAADVHIPLSTVNGDDQTDDDITISDEKPKIDIAPRFLPPSHLAEETCAQEKKQKRKRGAAATGGGIGDGGVSSTRTTIPLRDKDNTKAAVLRLLSRDEDGKMTLDQIMDVFASDEDDTYKSVLARTKSGLLRQMCVAGHLRLEKETNSWIITDLGRIHVEQALKYGGVGGDSRPAAAGHADQVVETDGL